MVLIIFSSALPLPLPPAQSSATFSPPPSLQPLLAFFELETDTRYLYDKVKPVQDGFRRLNLTLLEVVKKEIMKLYAKCGITIVETSRLISTTSGGVERPHNKDDFVLPFTTNKMLAKLTNHDF